MQYILGAVAAIFAANGLAGVILQVCIAIERKSPGESHWNKLPFVARGSDARFYGAASLALGAFAAFAAYQVGSVGGGA